MSSGPWKVGELARRTGLTVRTLHHYDALGLVCPRRTSGGQRVYGARDLTRLQQVISLRQMGVGLADIARMLKRHDVSVVGTIRAHLDRLREETALQQRLCERIDTIVRALESRRAADTEDVLWVLQGMNMHEKYLTPEQMADIKKRGEALGEAHIREAEAEWPRLIAAVRSEMQKGTDPAGERVQTLVRRWVALVKEFTGGDPGIGRAVGKMFANEPALRDRTNIDAEIMAYVGKAMAAGGLSFSGTRTPGPGTTR